MSELADQPDDWLAAMLATAAVGSYGEALGRDRLTRVMILAAMQQAVDVEGPAGAARLFADAAVDLLGSIA